MRLQKHYHNIALNYGSGCLERSKYGAFIAYSRISVNSLLEQIREVKPIVKSLEDMMTIFLLGPTPRFYGETRASTSWRREFIEYIDGCENLNDNFLIVLPEPKSCNWKDVDFPNLIDKQHIYAQVHWEDYFINLAAKTGLLVLHAHFRWGGNAGPTARIETGKLLALSKENLVRAAVINYPQDCETAEYIESHLLDMENLYVSGYFSLTHCTPLELNSNDKPIDNIGNIIEAGIYSDGSSEKGSLDIFFNEIVRIALKVIDTSTK